MTDNEVLSFTGAPYWIEVSPQYHNDKYDWLAITNLNFDLEFRRMSKQLVGINYRLIMSVEQGEQCYRFLFTVHDTIEQEARFIDALVDCVHVENLLNGVAIEP